MALRPARGWLIANPPHYAEAKAPIVAPRRHRFVVLCRADKALRRVGDLLWPTSPIARFSGHMKCGLSTRCDVQYVFECAAGC